MCGHCYRLSSRVIAAGVFACAVLAALSALAGLAVLSASVITGLGVGRRRRARGGG